MPGISNSNNRMVVSIFAAIYGNLYCVYQIEALPQLDASCFYAYFSCAADGTGIQKTMYYAD